MYTLGGELSDFYTFQLQSESAVPPCNRPNDLFRFIFGLSTTPFIFFREIPFFLNSFPKYSSLRALNLPRWRFQYLFFKFCFCMPKNTIVWIKGVGRRILSLLKYLQKYRLKEKWVYPEKGMKFSSENFCFFFANLVILKWNQKFKMSILNKKVKINDDLGH